MIPWHTIPIATLAAFAARERDLRVDQWPAAVADGRMTAREADDDILAWHALADLLATGSTDVDRTWTEIIAAIDLAATRRRDALDQLVQANDPAPDHRRKLDGAADRLWHLRALASFARDQRTRHHVTRLDRPAKADKPIARAA